MIRIKAAAVAAGLEGAFWGARHEPYIFGPGTQRRIEREAEKIAALKATPLPATPMSRQCRRQLARAAAKRLPRSAT
jgi:hypothetical protein